MKLGYTLLGEQAGPRELVLHAAAAEAAGFDFAVASDSFSPRLATQGHSPYVWSVLGAVAQVTAGMDLMTYVTCPIMRYHPVVVAQKAATMQILSRGRFALGLGDGENLNEHVVGRAWPEDRVRQAMLSEAVDIILALFGGGEISYDGAYFRTDSARLWDLPDVRVPLGVGVADNRSVRAFAPRADIMIAVEPRASLAAAWDAVRTSPAGGTSSPGSSRKIGQVPVSWDRDEGAAVRRAHEQYRWFLDHRGASTGLPGTSSVDAATRRIKPRDVRHRVPCGHRVERIVEAVRRYVVAGFTDIALVQIGGDTQGSFIEAAEHEILPALRESIP
ncbi:MAG: TIGR03557 family F420-dependent LLM class oxidoreductase [Actinomycetales bacterium]|nr:TIGR03557 family F420-dependent LLM class oxidoreductase [Actinomycetales bacterium]